MPPDAAAAFAAWIRDNQHQSGQRMPPHSVLTELRMLAHCLDELE